MPEASAHGPAICSQFAAKLTVAPAPLIVTGELLGEKVKPNFEGVMTYEPLVIPVKLYVPDVLEVTLAVAAPVSLTVALRPPLPLIVPVMT